MDDLIELDSLLTDIADLLDRAERLADLISGAEAGRAPVNVLTREPCPECNGRGRFTVLDGEATMPCDVCNGRGTYTAHYIDPGSPAVEGWPAFVGLANILDSMVERLKAARAGEVDDAIKAARKESMDAPEPIQPGDEHYYNR